MTQRTPGILAVLFAVVATLLLVMTGCGVDRPPSGTRPPSSADSQFFLDLAANPSAQGVKDRPGANSVPRTPRVLSKSFVVDGAAGAEISFGRFTLVIPPGAFEGSRQITLEDPDNGFVESRLFPEGLQFAVPVTLAMDLANSSLDGTDATIYWYDPRADVWVDLGGTYSPAASTVSVQLEHFSTYRGGRAGW